MSLLQLLRSHTPSINLSVHPSNDSPSKTWRRRTAHLVLIGYLYNILFASCSFAISYQEPLDPIWKTSTNLSFKIKETSSSQDKTKGLKLKIKWLEQIADSSKEGDSAEDSPQLKRQEIFLTEDLFQQKGFQSKENQSQQWLLWKFETLSFLIGRNGAVHLRGDPASQAPTLKIVSPTGVTVESSLKTNHLMVSAPYLLQQGHSQIGRLDTWLHPIQTLNNLSGFYNTHTLTCGQLHVHQGGLANTGTLNLADQGEAHLYSNPLYNYGDLTLGLKAHLQEANLFYNDNRVSGSDYKLEVKDFHNKNTIHADHLQLITTGTAQNSGHIESQKQINLTSSGSWQEDGRIKSPIMKAQFNALDNHGDIEADQVNFRGKLLKNTAAGTLTLKADSTFNVTTLENDGEIKSQGCIEGHIGILNNHGLIETRKKFRVSGTHMHNRGKVIADQGLSYSGDTLLTGDQSALITQGSLRLALKQDFINAGLVQGDQETHLNSPAFLNKGRYLSPGLTFLPTYFTNQGEADLNRVDWQIIGGNSVNQNLSNSNILKIHNSPFWLGLKKISNNGNMTLENSPFVTDQVSNTGQLHLQGGTYEAKGTFTNGPTARTVLREYTHTRAQHYDSPGVWESLVDLKLDFQGNTLPAFNQIKAAGSLDLKLGQGLNAAEFLTPLQGHLTYTNQLKINAPRFDSTQDLSFLTPVEINTHSFRNTKTLASQGDLEINAPSLDNRDGKIKSTQKLKLNTQQLLTTDSSEITTPGELEIKATRGFATAGLLQGGRKTSIDAPNFTNTGRYLSPTATLLKTRFTNQGHAELGAVQWPSTGNPYGLILYNGSGTLKISNTASWGEFKSLINMSTMSLHNSPFVFDQVQNHGQLHFQGGTYRVNNTFINGSEGHVTLGTDTHTIAQDYNSAGIWESLAGLKFDLQGTTLPNFKQIRAAGALELQLGQTLNAAEFLAQSQGHLTYTDRLKINTPRFESTWDLNLPTPVELNTQSFRNTKTLTTHGLTLNTQTFVNGLLGQLAKIISHGPLQITAQNDIDTRWGKIESTSDMSLISRAGNVLVGDSIPGQQIRLAPNGAHIASGGTLTVQAENIHFDYGTLFSHGLMDLITRGLITFKGGTLWSKGGARLVGKKLEVLRETPEKYQSGTGHDGYKRRGTEWHVWWPIYSYRDLSAPSLIQIQGGDLRFNMSESIKIESSHVIVEGVIYNGAGTQPLNLQNFDPAQLANLLRMHFFIGSNAAGSPAQMQSGQNIILVSNGGLVNHGGSVHGANIYLNFDSLLAENLSLTRNRQPAQTRVIALASPTNQGLSAVRSLMTRAPTSAPHTYELVVPATEPSLNRTQVHITGDQPRDSSTIRFSLSPSILSMVVNHALAREAGSLNHFGLRGDALITHLHAKGQKLAPNPEDLSQAIESMIVYKVRRVHKDLMDIADKRRELEEELEPLMVLAGQQQNLLALESGAITGDHEGVIKAQTNITHIGNTVAFDNLTLHAKQQLFLDRSKHVEVSDDGSTHTRREIAHPAMQLIVRDKGTVTAGKLYQERGAFLQVGAGGLTRGATDDDGVALSLPFTTQTIITQTPKSKSKTGKTKRQTTRSTQTAGSVSEVFSVGPLNFISGEHGKGYLEGTEHHTTDEVFFEGGPTTYERALFKDTFTSDKKGSVRKTGCSSESAVDLGGSIATTGNVHFNTASPTVVAGIPIRAQHIYDNVPGSTTFCEKQLELRNMSYKSGLHGLGRAKARNIGGQASMTPTIFQAESFVSHSTNSEDTLIWRGVVARLERMEVYKRFVEQAVVLRSWQQTTSQTRGLSTPFITFMTDVSQGRSVGSAFGSMLRDASVVGAVDGWKDAGNTPDRIAAGLKVTSQALDDLKTLYNLWNSPGKGALDLVSRFTQVNLGGTNTKSTFNQTRSVGNDVEAAHIYIKSPFWHHIGAMRTYPQGEEPSGDFTVQVDTFSVAPLTGTMQASTQSKSGSIGFNPLTGCVSFNVGGSSSSESHKTHQPSTIATHHLFLRTNDAEHLEDLQATATITDLDIKQHMDLASVLDEHSSKQKGFSGGLDIGIGTPKVQPGGLLAKQGQKPLPGNFAYSDREKVDKVLSHLAYITGTQQFYLRVGGKLITRSAHVGLEDDGTAVPTLQTTDGQVFYERPMPIADNDCLFFSLETTRQEATELLLANAEREDIRRLVAPEIKEAITEGRLPSAMQADEGFRNLQGYKDRLEGTWQGDRLIPGSLNTAVSALNTTLGVSGYTIDDLLMLDREGQDPRFAGLRAVKEEIDTLAAMTEAYAQSEAAYRRFITHHVAVTGNMMSYIRDIDGRGATSTVDALAKLLGVDLRIYVKEGASLTPVHTFHGGERILNLYNTVYQPLDEREVVAAYSGIAEEDVYELNAQTDNEAAPESKNKEKRKEKGKEKVKEQSKAQAGFRAKPAAQLNHFNRLETEREIIEASEIVTTQLEETHERSGFAMNLPFGTLRCLGNQLQDWQEILADIQAGLSTEERLALERQRQLEAAEDHLQREAFTDTVLEAHIADSDLSEDDKQRLSEEVKSIREDIVELQEKAQKASTQQKSTKSLQKPPLPHHKPQPKGTPGQSQASSTPEPAAQSSLSSPKVGFSAAPVADEPDTLAHHGAKSARGIAERIRAIAEEYPIATFIVRMLAEKVRSAVVEVGSLGTAEPLAFVADKATEKIIEGTEKLTGMTRQQIRDKVIESTDEPLKVVESILGMTREDTGTYLAIGGTILETVLAKGKSGGKLTSKPASSSTEVLRGTRNPKVKEAARKGREEHAKLKQKVEAKQAKNPGWRAEERIKVPSTQQVMIPDVITPSGRFIELKPNTPSGRKQGARQAKKYEAALEKKGKIIYYEPK